MEEQKITDNDWIKKELEETKSTSFDGEKLPALVLEENKICEIIVDFTKPFQSWEDKENNTTKKIIPVTVKEEKLVWWLNVKNPVYHKMVESFANKGQTTFKILQTGTQKNTRYAIVED